MAIAIFDKNNNQFHRCLETSSKVSECGYDNADWWKNVTVSDSDWAAIIDGTKLPVSVNDSNEITWEEDFHQVDTTQEEAQEDQGALVISSCQFLNLLDHNHGTLVAVVQAQDQVDRLVVQEVAQV